MSRGQMGLPGSNRGDLERLLREGHDYRDMGRFDLARRAAIAVLVIDPRNEDARNLRVECDTALAEASRKSQPKLQVVSPQIGDDYDGDEATNVVPMDVEVLDHVVASAPRPAMEAGPDDPDVQEALRWLDPPHNVPVERAHTSSGQMRALMVPPGRVYPQFVPGYPQAMYQTPVPGVSVMSSGYYTPAPGTQSAVNALPVRPPSPWPWIVATVVVMVLMGGGIVLGWFLFAKHAEGNVASAARAPAVAPAPAQPAVTPPVQQPVAPPVQQQPVAPAPTEENAVAPAPEDPAVAPPAAPTPPPSTVKAAVTSIGRGAGVNVASPISGEVAKVFARSSATVRKGAKLLQVTHRTAADPRHKKLSARVAELEQLAQNDPVYKDFLDDARAELKKASGGRTETAVVKAPADGVFEADVSVGEKVGGGDKVGSIKGGWSVKATAQGQVPVTKTWKCTLTNTDGKSAPCRIANLKPSGSNLEVEATVRGDDAPWLRADQRPELTLDPP